MTEEWGEEWLEPMPFGAKKRPPRMKELPPLALHRIGDRATAVEAARKAENAGNLGIAVVTRLMYEQEFEGNHHEIYEAARTYLGFAWSPDVIRHGVVCLERGGCLEDTGRRSPGQHGTPATVWRWI